MTIFALPLSVPDSASFTTANVAAWAVKSIYVPTNAKAITNMPPVRRGTFIDVTSSFTLLAKEVA